MLVFVLSKFYVACNLFRLLKSQTNSPDGNLGSFSWWVIPHEQMLGSWNNAIERKLSLLFTIHLSKSMCYADFRRGTVARCHACIFCG